MRKCVFFDRDGIVNVPPEESGYVCRPEDFEVIPEFIDSLRIVSQAGFDAVIITNQQGVGKGLYSQQTLNRIHNKLIDQLDAEGMSLLAIYCCPHLATVECVCRKPKPGMLLQAAREWEIDLSASWMIGDSFRDVEAGKRAGCKTVYVGSQACPEADWCIDDMRDLPNLMDAHL